VRDLLLSEAIRRLATEAATRFSTLVAAGDQIPFDVAAGESDEESPFYSYVPLTGRYVEERSDELRALPSFRPAREAAIEAGVAAPYLEARGEIVPADPGERAERMLIHFFASLWEGSTGFALDRDRLETALGALDAETRDADEAEVLIVPVVGLRTSCARIQLPHDVRIVRADSIELPAEARHSEGMGRAAWEPQLLAIVEQPAEEGAEAALRQLRDLISVMRLFTGGGVGLGPYAFAPTGEGAWRRVATGAPAARPGGYRLSEAEAEALVSFAEALESRPDPDGALSWAVGRFERGCERESALEGLSDHLLALRAVLEGHGPVGASLPLRAAALIADEDVLDRVDARERMEEALELERALMNGRCAERAIELAAWIEEGARRLLRRAALGELGSDLTAAAEETLIATGLAGGDPQITISVQPSEPTELPEPPAEPQEDQMEQETRIMEPIPAEDEIKITATPWLEEISDGRPGDSLEWPADGDRDLQHRERIDTPRVRHLFPVPDDAEWEVHELEYSHYRGRAS
jgi:hypothetical protein